MNHVQALIKTAASLTEDESVLVLLRIAYLSAGNNDYALTLEHIVEAGNTARGEKCKGVLRLAYMDVVNSTKPAAPRPKAQPRVRTSRPKAAWTISDPVLVAAKAEAMATGKSVVVRPAFPKKAA